MLRCQLKTISHDDNNKMVAKNSIKNFSFTIYHKLILVPCMKMNNFIKKKQKYYIVYEFVFGDMVARLIPSKFELSIIHNIGQDLLWMILLSSPIFKTMILHEKYVCNNGRGSDFIRSYIRFVFCWHFGGFVNNFWY